jgi:hypothetical protein
VNRHPGEGRDLLAAEPHILDEIPAYAGMT